jgi:hypothetical protein
MSISLKKRILRYHLSTNFYRNRGLNSTLVCKNLLSNYQKLHYRSPNARRKWSDYKKQRKGWGDSLRKNNNSWNISLNVWKLWAKGMNRNWNKWVKDWRLRYRALRRLARLSRQRSTCCVLKILNLLRSRSETLSFPWFSWRTTTKWKGKDSKRRTWRTARSMSSHRQTR